MNVGVTSATEITANMAATTHEFKLTYPASDADDVNLTDEDNFDIIDEADLQEEIPVVILLGWAGCIDKHLSKYSEIYERKGFITIRHVFPSSALFFNYDQLKPMAKKVLDVVYEQNLQHHPIVFHIFSNGGCFIYCHVTSLIETRVHYRDLLVKGCVVDSAPGKRRVLKATLAFMQTLHTHVFVRYVLGFCLLIYLIFSRVFCSLLGRDLGSDNPFYVFENMCDDKSKWPQLFLFSKADKVIGYGDIQEVVDCRKNHGICVHSVCWDDSGHVNHFREHREVYIKKCHEFVSLCLSSK